MTDPNIAVLRALGLPEKLGLGIASVVVRLDPGKLPMAEISVIVGMDADAQQTEMQRFNIVPIKE